MGPFWGWERSKETHSAGIYADKAPICPCSNWWTGLSRTIAESVHSSLWSLIVDIETCTLLEMVEFCSHFGLNYVSVYGNSIKVQLLYFLKITLQRVFLQGPVWCGDNLSMARFQGWRLQRSTHSTTEPINFLHARIMHIILVPTHTDLMYVCPITHTDLMVAGQVFLLGAQGGDILCLGICKQTIASYFDPIWAKWYAIAI